MDFKRCILIGGKRYNVRESTLRGGGFDKDLVKGIAEKYSETRGFDKDLVKGIAEKYSETRGFQSYDEMANSHTAFLAYATDNPGLFDKSNDKYWTDDTDMGNDDPKPEVGILRKWKKPITVVVTLPTNSCVRKGIVTGIVKHKFPGHVIVYTKNEYISSCTSPQEIIPLMSLNNDSNALRVKTPNFKDLTQEELDALERIVNIHPIYNELIKHVVGNLSKFSSAEKVPNSPAHASSVHRLPSVNGVELNKDDILKKIAGLNPNETISGKNKYHVYPFNCDAQCVGKSVDKTLQDMKDKKVRIWGTWVESANLGAANFVSTENPPTVGYILIIYDEAGNVVSISPYWKDKYTDSNMFHMMTARVIECFSINKFYGPFGNYAMFLTGLEKTLNAGLPDLPVRQL